MLEVKDLELSFGETAVLNGVNLSIEEGETVGLIGPNGSGKTTLFNCICGFLPRKSGKVVFKGKAIDGLRPYQRARQGLGRVFQNFGVFKEMTVLENMITAIEENSIWYKVLFPWSKRSKEIKKEAIEYLKLIGFEEKLSQKAGALSGGQMRLLEIVRTLAFGADLFLLDEPTAGVAPKLKDDVAKLIRKLNEDNKTVFVIEHDIDFIEQFCSRIIVLDQGRVVLDGPPEEIRGNTELHEIYFGKGEPQST